MLFQVEDGQPLLARAELLSQLGDLCELVPKGVLGLLVRAEHVDGRPRRRDAALVRAGAAGGRGRLEAVVRGRHRPRRDGALVRGDPRHGALARHDLGVLLGVRGRARGDPRGVAVGRARGEVGRQVVEVGHLGDGRGLARRRLWRRDRGGDARGGAVGRAAPRGHALDAGVGRGAVARVDVGGAVGEHVGGGDELDGVGDLLLSDGIGVLGGQAPLGRHRGRGIGGGFGCPAGSEGAGDHGGHRGEVRRDGVIVVILGWIENLGYTGQSDLPDMYALYRVSIDVGVRTRRSTVEPVAHTRPDSKRRRAAAGKCDVSLGGYSGSI